MEGRKEGWRVNGIREKRTWGGKKSIKRTQEPTSSHLGPIRQRIPPVIQLKDKQKCFSDLPNTGSLK